MFLLFKKKKRFATTLKRKQNNSRVFKIALVIFSIVTLVGLYFLLSQNLLVVKKTDFDFGNMSCAKSDDVKKEIKILGKNFVTIDEGEIKRNLIKKYSCIKDVVFIKKFPDEVKIKLNNRRAFGALLFYVDTENKEATEEASLVDFVTEATASVTVNKEVVVDDEGVIFANYEGQNNIPRVYMPDKGFNIGQKITDGSVQKMDQIFETLKVLGLSVNDAKIYSDSILVTDTKPKVVISLERDISKQLASLQLILAQAKIDQKDMEIVTLRFDNPVVKYKPQKKGQ